MARVYRFNANGDVKVIDKRGNIETALETIGYDEYLKVMRDENVVEAEFTDTWDF